MIPYRVQVMGGIAIHKGDIAEMRTGEGKTLTTFKCAGRSWRSRDYSQ